MKDRLFGGLNTRSRAGLLVMAAFLTIAPALLDGYLLSVLLITLYFAYVGQAWNLMMGYAGQLSLGHSLYVGIGGYAAGALFVHFGLPPLAGLVLGIVIAVAMGVFIGALAFRFGIGGVYFALLTIAFAEFTRILIEHLDFLGGTAGMFLPVENRDQNDLWNLRGEPAMFYYVILALAVGGLALNRALIKSKLGYYWLAIREDQDAAQALGVNVFRYKIIAVALSAALTSVGGVVLAFYYNNLFPHNVLSMHKSIEIILAPIIGGLGTLMGPIVGAFILTPLGELMTLAVESLGIQIAGVKQIFYGVILLLIIRFLPGGVWPAVADKLGFVEKEGGKDG